FGPGQTGDKADFILLMRLRVAELRNSEQVFERRSGHTLHVRRILHDAPRHLAADVSNFALKVTNAGLTRVVPDDLAQRIVVEADLLLRKPRRLTLLAHQVLPRNLQLL